MYKSIFAFSFLVTSTLLSFSISAAPKNFPDTTAIIKGTVSAKTNTATADKSFISDAVVVLTAAGKAEIKFETKTDESGAFILENIPAGNYVLTVEASGLPKATRDLKVDAGAVLSLDIDLNVEVAEQVVVRYEEGLLSTSETTVSNVIRSETLQSQPFRDDEYQNALPLTPGIVKDPLTNASYVKGARAGQSRFTVNGADVTDPVSGQPIFEIPLEAVNNIKVEENPYSAEFGQFTGGFTQLQTKGGANKFDFRVSRLFPTFGGFFRGKIESFRPRVTVSGPIVKDKLFFLQSFEYRFRREENPDLPEGADFRKIERVTSFTQFDYTINKTNQLKVYFSMFPQKTQFANINFFNPQASTYNVKQRGYIASISEQAVFKNTSFLTSTFNYFNADFDIFGNGGDDYTVVSDFNRGNYFGDLRRKSNRFQLSETYYFAPFDFKGKHSLKIGGEFNRSRVSNLFNFEPIYFRRLNSTLTQSIFFANPEQTKYTFAEAGIFAQDNFVASPKLTLDFGLRYDYDGVGKENNISPRFAFLLTPFDNNKRTVIRGGVGVFYDKTLPVAGYFADDFDGTNFRGIPRRTILTFGANGSTLTSFRGFSNVVDEDIKTPRSVRWSIHLDQGITDDLTFRFGYLERNSRNDLIIEPFVTSTVDGIYLLSSSGRSKYREFQILANYFSEKHGNFNFSYTFSKAKGDLNTADVLINNIHALNIQPNQYSLLPFDAPHRFLAYGQIALPFDILLAPMVEYRTGFPFSAVNDRLEYVGERNRAGRFPDYFSVDVQITKGFKVPLPIIKKYKLRAGVALFNIFNRFNPRDVQNNVENPLYGTFYNSLRFGTKLQFGIDR